MDQENAPGAGAETPQKSPPSVAKVQASRANGGRSHGPISETGKLRSRENAVKHGLLANRIYPPGSDPREKLEYQQCLEGLIAEFNPQTQTEQNLVENLALDWVLIARTSAYIARLISPMVTFEPVPQQTKNLRHRLAVVRASIRRMKSGQRLRIKEEDLRSFGNVILDQVNRFDFNEQWFGRKPPPEPDGSERPRKTRPMTKEQIRLQELYEHILPVGLPGRSFPEKLVSGEIKLTENDRKRWLLLLAEVVRVLEANRLVKKIPLHQRRKTTADDAALFKRNLEALRIAQEYDDRRRRGFERRLATLVQLQRLRAEAQSPPHAPSFPAVLLREPPQLT